MATFNQEVTPVVGLTATAISGNGSSVGVVIDTAGFEATDVVMEGHVITDGVYDLLLEHDDVIGFGTATTVLATDLDADISTVQLVAADDDTRKRIGYVGKKQFIRATVVATSVGTGGQISVGINEGRPHLA